jgi:SAM-dependent methyltransferase
MKTKKNDDPQYDPAAVTAYFDDLAEKEWERMVADPFAEVRHHVHTHYLREHVPPEARVLDIGAGPGRYTQLLAEMGCTITVADISPTQLALNQDNAHRLGFAGAVAAWHQLDICHMMELADATFDTVLAYGGPLSYVLDAREQALQECMRVTRPGGLLLFGVMSLWGSAHMALRGVMKIPPETNEIIIRTGDLTVETMPNSRHYCHMFRAAELRAFLDRPALNLLALSASNVLSTNWPNLLAEIREDEQKWSELLRMEVEAGAEPGCLDMGTHLIAVVEKAR